MFISVPSANRAQALSHNRWVQEKPAPEAAYTAGLIHNLGMLALVHAFPEQMERVLNQKNPDDSHRLLAQSIGIDYRTAGGWLAQRWGLPEELVLTITHHENPSYRGAAWPLVQLVGLTSQMATALYQGNVKRALTSSRPGDELVAAADSEQAVTRLFEQADKLKGLAQLLAGGGHP